MRTRSVPRFGLLLVVLVILIYRKSLPAWIWILSVGIIVVAVVFYLISMRFRGRR